MRKKICKPRSLVCDVSLAPHTSSVPPLLIGQMSIWWLAYLMWRCLWYFRWQKGNKLARFPDRKKVPKHKSQWQPEPRLLESEFGHKVLNSSELNFCPIVHPLSWLLHLFSWSKQTIKLQQQSTPQGNSLPAHEQGSLEALASKGRNETLNIAHMRIYFLKARLWS